MKCPECKGRMAERSFEGRDGRQVTLVDTLLCSGPSGWRT